MPIDHISSDLDSDLSVRAIIMKYQLDFTEYFGPSHAYGVHDIDYRGSEIQVIARVKPAHQPTKGPTTTFSVDPGKFAVWRNNVKLYAFIS